MIVKCIICEVFDGKCYLKMVDVLMYYYVDYVNFCWVKVMVKCGKIGLYIFYKIYVGGW